MAPVPSLPLLLLLILSTIFALTAFASPADHSPNPNGDIGQFQALLNTIADSDIHEVLSRFDSRFKDGVFHHDRTAIEAVHSEDPAVATELVKLARNKRQVSNSTMTTAPVTTSEAPATSETPHTTTSAPHTTLATTTNSEIRTSVVAPSSPTGAIIVSSTSGAVVYSKTNGGLTTIRSSTALVSYKPSSTTLLITTTLPGGETSTITSVAVVDSPYTTLSDTAVAAQSATGTAQPSLQSGASLGRTILNPAIAILAGLGAVILAV